MASTADTRSDRHQLIDSKLIAATGHDLAHMVALGRPEISWRKIARDVWHLTGIDVSHQALMNWFGEDDTEAGQ